MEITNEQVFNSIRNDPRYLDLVKRLGLEETLNRNWAAPERRNPGRDSYQGVLEPELKQSICWDAAREHVPF
jgi:hypothetical protein